MCRVYDLHADTEQLAQQFEVELPFFPPNYSIKTTLNGLVIRQDQAGKKAGAILRWGLVPAWAKDQKIGSSLVNARAETVAEKPAFRTALKKRRCLVLANGFYEAKAITQKEKQYNYIHLQDNQPFAFAGLWERWAQGGEVLETFTICTTEPNPLMAKIHNRMPVIVQPAEYDVWLDPEVPPGALLDTILSSREYAGQVADQVTNRAWTREGNSPEAVEAVKTRAECAEPTSAAKTQNIVGMHGRA